MKYLSSQQRWKKCNLQDDVIFLLLIIGKCYYSEFHAPLQKQLITLQKFNIPISIDISIKTH